MLVLMTAATASAQWAVADAPNLAQNVKNFSELQKQVGYLKEQQRPAGRDTGHDAQGQLRHLQL